jgi:undecaprenyl-diphosphatase
LAAPVMAGAGLLEIHEILNQINLEVILSFLSALVVGLLAIHLLMGYVRKNNFNIFVFYRIVLALILLSIYLYR